MARPFINPDEKRIATSVAISKKYLNLIAKEADALKSPSGKPASTSEIVNLALEFYFKSEAKFIDDDIESRELDYLRREFGSFED